MPLHQVTYNLPEELSELRTAMNASKWESVVREMDMQLRAIAKHGDDQVKAAYAQDWRDRLHEEMNHEGLEMA